MKQSFYDDSEYNPEYNTEYDLQIKKRSFYTPRPMQLARKHCNCVKCEWRGQEKQCEQKYVTFSEMKAFYKEQIQNTFSRIKAEEIKESKQKQEIVSNLEKDTHDQEKMRPLNYGSLIKKSSNEPTTDLIPQSCDEIPEPTNSEIESLTKEVPLLVIKSRMCNSVGTGKQCVHKSNCRFAHSISELEFSICSFGSECFKVKKQSNGIYTNCGVQRKYCDRKHPDETKENVCVRMGLLRFKQIPPVKKESIFIKTDLSVREPAWQKPIFLVAPKALDKSVREPAWQKPIFLVAPKAPEDIHIDKSVLNNAMSTLANKKLISDHLVRTRMCNSVGTGKTCPHKQNCRFAHSVSELEIPKCLLGSACKYVILQPNGVYTTVKGKFCNRKHPGETNENFCERTDTSKVVSPWKKEIPFVQNKAVDDLVIRVSNVFAMEAIELAVNSGNNNITLEIIN